MIDSTVKLQMHVALYDVVAPSIYTHRSKLNLNVTAAERLLLAYHLDVLPISVLCTGRIFATVCVYACTRQLTEAFGIDLLSSIPLFCCIERLQTFRGHLCNIAWS